MACARLSLRLAVFGRYPELPSSGYRCDRRGCRVDGVHLHKTRVLEPQGVVLSWNTSSVAPESAIFRDAPADAYSSATITAHLKMGCGLKFMDLRFPCYHPTHPVPNPSQHSVAPSKAPRAPPRTVWRAPLFGQLPHEQVKHHQDQNSYDTPVHHRHPLKREYRPNAIAL